MKWVYFTRPGEVCLLLGGMLVTATSWFQQAIFYQIYLRAFADGNGDGIGDFPGLTAHLDYLQDLGVDCLWIMPMYPSPLQDDGYDISDFYAIHPDYGSLADFQAFLAAAHARGLKVIVDLVLNHVSDQHPWFQAARSDPASPFRDYFVWSDTPDRYPQARVIFLDSETSNWSWDEQAGQFYWHRFYACQPDLNFANPAVQDEMLQVCQFWLAQGIDGFRVDAVPYLFEREGTNCENLPETHAYLKRLRAFVQAHAPQAILLCEANQWPEDVRAYFGQGDEFHLAFNFPVMPRLFMALAQADRTPLVDITRRLPPIPPDCQWCTFLRNHDELTLEMVTPQERQFLWAAYAPQPRMRLNLGIRRRLAPLLDGDRRKIELLTSLLLTLPGAPILYYGDEIGMGDAIQLPDRMGVRTPMQWSAAPNAGFSAAPPERLYLPPIADERYGYPLVNVQAQQATPGSLWQQVRHLLAVRKTQPVLAAGAAAFLDELPRPVVGLFRQGEGEQLLALHNLSPQEQSLALSLPPLAGRGVVDLLSPRSLPPLSSAPYPLTLPPFGYAWLKFQ